MASYLTVVIVYIANAMYPVQFDDTKGFHTGPPQFALQQCYMRSVSLDDHTDNWIGREYAASEASAAQGWQLADWFIKSIDPLFIIRGNHNARSGHGDPLEYIKMPGSLCEKRKAIVELRWPNGRTAVLDYAHDHVGTSQSHPLHGQVRQARFNHTGIDADLYIAGHRQTWGLMTTEMQGRVV